MSENSAGVDSTDHPVGEGADLVDGEIEEFDLDDIEVIESKVFG
ncbi:MULTISPECIES: TglA family RiPP precursor [Actinokineospora]|uniref:Uncharacterized protein n=1 Tax=Actinokineospora fastidiosa TaxID=1816 RepID=A0A918G9J3_9PSEU|nr:MULTISPECIES: TglA family RiPP precursor [Actinokineospora]UVS81927.1 hypothetical protein Actkin_05691 [Actinokineospora sp. UTMC 2448]GGS24776.1 hypothetical protein GCM10010171_17470 [Actinokineospora fastidiosa]